MSLDKITVWPVTNVHSHIREDEVVGPFIEFAWQGGTDLLGPMPNTMQGLKTAQETISYIQEAGMLAEEAGINMHFMPIGMLTEQTTLNEIEEFAKHKIRHLKVYPRNRTTKSESGVTQYGNLIEKVRLCGELGITVHFHPENPEMRYDNRDAEFAFLTIVKMFLDMTDARIVWEHGTDARCIPFWKDMAETGRFFVTLTAHHLLIDENTSFGDVRSVCKPPAKTFNDREQLVRFVMEDNLWVMAGADDAPHNKSSKHPSHGQCACGAYTAPFLLQLYAHALHDLFENERGISIFERFINLNARRIHELPESTRKVTLVREPYTIPVEFKAADWTVESFWAGQKLNWSLVEGVLPGSEQHFTIGG